MGLSSLVMATLQHGFRCPRFLHLLAKYFILLRFNALFLAHVCLVHTVEGTTMGFQIMLPAKQP